MFDSSMFPCTGETCKITLGIAHSVDRNIFRGLCTDVLSPQLKFADSRVLS
jgi:hypothetical protein